MPVPGSFVPFLYLWLSGSLFFSCSLHSCVHNGVFKELDLHVCCLAPSIENCMNGLGPPQMMDLQEPCFGYSPLEGVMSSPPEPSVRRWFG